MNLPVRLLNLAKREADAAARWYEHRQPGLGRRFLHVLHDTLLDIEQRPTHHSHLETVPEDAPIHRAVTKTFPYLVIYELRSEEVLVLAIAHSRRRPNYWKRRRKQE